MKLTGVCLITAPLFFLCYGIIRLVGRLDGQYGPGLDWQAAHVSNLIGLLLCVPLALGLGRLLAGTRGRGLAVGLTLVGVATSVVQFVVDIVAGLLAADRAEMSAISRGFTSLPGVQPVFYQVGPQLMFVGLLVLAVLLARAKALPWWGPVLVLAGPCLGLVSLDLLPVAALCLLAGFAPLALRLLRGTAAPLPRPSAATALTASPRFR
ncbi:hypothetical protein [Goodfellowiella coeruleoviolacea]|uniref:DUF4386 domain-containing protein n=1 Tax=Goodfellowiella coeruleoviolacea TaxID=334858 RepID=A0AAE3GLR6_9PSEU|nr:hypothetical protein [Goodfellowiella coeruleoviolacea]MCP2169739.1 hypothetical protein [Goodfellowiella coeruleoviolacea]